MSTELQILRSNKLKNVENTLHTVIHIVFAVCQKEWKISTSSNSFNFNHQLLIYITYDKMYLFLK